MTNKIPNKIKVTNARKQLYKLIENVQDNHEPLYIIGKNANAVLLSEADWQAIKETLYLASIPGMRESIVTGMKQSLKKCDKTPGW